jgi:hypothetical protein
MCSVQDVPVLSRVSFHISARFTGWMIGISRSYPEQFSFPRVINLFGLPNREKYGLKNIKRIADAL